MLGVSVGAIALLLVAGLPRLVWGSPSQRALAAALCSSAAVLLLELDPVEDLLSTAGLAGPGALAQCLCVTLAAAAAFGMARHVSPTPVGPRVSPAAVGVPVGVLQVLLYAASGTPGAPATHALFPDHIGNPAVAGLWVLTAAGPVAAGAVLLPVLRTYGPGLQHRRGRIAVACTFAGSVLIAFGGASMAVQLLLAAAGWPGVERLGAAAAPLAPVGLAVVACGVLASRVVTVVLPVVHWFGAHLALRRLDGLAGALMAAAPEWAVSSVEDRWAVRKPAGQLYRRVIAIRDASWTLFGLVDGSVAVDCAVAFARSRRGFLGEQAVAALVEACWLRYAVEARARGARPPGPEPAHFPERVPEPPGSLHEESAFLVAVARAWRDPVIEEFLAECFPDDCHRQLRTA